MRYNLELTTPSRFLCMHVFLISVVLFPLFNV
jgi:hypothetical protein